MRSAWSHGFTLIEIMVVLIIMGLFVGLVSTITRPDDRALLRLETERLAQLLDLASTESRLSGRRVAWTAEASGYRFWRFTSDTNWTEIRDVDSLRPRMLPQGMRIAAVRVENLPPRENMRLEFTSFGQTFAFGIDVTFGPLTASVEGSPIGGVRVVPDHLETGNAIPERRQ